MLPRRCGFGYAFVDRSPIPIANNAIHKYWIAHSGSVAPAADRLTRGQMAGVMTARTIKRLEAIVGTLVAERFPDAQVDRIAVQPDHDSDGDKILRVSVIFKSALDDLDRDNSLGFVRMLRPRLIAAKSNEFPVVSFVAAEDAGRMPLEAA